MSSDSENAFPPFALATASSEATLAGFDRPNVTERNGIVEQLIPVGCDELRTVSVLLSNRNPQPTKIPARVLADDGRILRTIETPLPPGERQWVEFPVELSPLSGAKMGQYVRFQLELPERVSWLGTEPDPAFPGTGNVDAPATFCFRLSPPQPCFWPSNVLPKDGASNRFTGIWKSDPQKPFPQWLDISWKKPMNLRGIELEFPNPAETPAHYQIEISALGRISESVEVAENALPSRTHLFDAPIPADHVRLTVFASQSALSVSVGRITPILQVSRQE